MSENLGTRHGLILKFGVSFQSGVYLDAMAGSMLSKEFVGTKEL